MHWWNSGWAWWGWLAMSAAMVAFWGLVAWVLVALVPTPTGERAGDRRLPEDILADRFAAGEIDEKEYRRRLDVLRSTEVGAG